MPHDRAEHFSKRGAPSSLSSTSADSRTFFPSHPTTKNFETRFTNQTAQRFDFLGLVLFFFAQPRVDSGKPADLLFFSPQANSLTIRLPSSWSAVSRDGCYSTGQHTTAHAHTDRSTNTEPQHSYKLSYKHSYTMQSPSGSGQAVKVEERGWKLANHKPLKRVLHAQNRICLEGTTERVDATESQLPIKCQGTSVIAATTMPHSDLGECCPTNHPTLNISVVIGHSRLRISSSSST